MKSKIFCAIITLLLTLCFALCALPACAIPYQVGDVFVAVSNGKVQHYNAAGILLETLDTNLPSFTTGMAFDSLGNLYVTNFGAGTVSKLNGNGGLIGIFGSGYSGSPESILFDRNGNAYVGSVGGDNRIRKFDPLGNPLGSFIVATENVGSDWIELGPDQCTMFYTSEGPDIKRFNVCDNTQLSDFNAAPLPNPTAFALRILPDGGVLVANTTEIVRLDSTGQVVQTYNSPGQSCWFALNLDPDGKSFWSGDFCSSTVHKFDIQTGVESPNIINTGTGTFTVFGLVVFGELSGSKAADRASLFGRPSVAGIFADPVNTGIGNYYITRTDFTIPGRGLSVVFSRSYNSLDSYSGPFGAGWTHSYNVFARANPGGTVTVKEADGHEVLFVPAGGGAFTPQTKGVFDTLVQNIDASFTLTRKNQTQLTFSPDGKLRTIADRNSNEQTLFYDGFGNLKEIADTVGRSLSLAYDASNRIAQIMDPLGRSVAFVYDGSNNLVQSVDPAGGITQFAYDSNHRVTSITLPNGQLLLQNSYDPIGRVVSQTNGRGATSTFTYGVPTPTDTTITDARNNQTIHSYDSAFRILKITDAAGGVVSYDYDENNNRTRIINQNGKATNLAYDAGGNVTAITDPTANTSKFIYDNKNNLLLATDAKGNATSLTYDSNGNLTSIVDALGGTVALAYDSTGQMTSRKDARGNTTAYSYDSRGNLTRVTDALNNITALNYDPISRITSITDANGHSAAAAYDALSRLVKTTDALNHQTGLVYDPVGNLVKLTDANGNATSYSYDAVNNLSSVTDALGHITTYAYDSNNNRTGVTNAKGNSTAYAFDALNRLVAVTDPLSFVTTYTYDAVGNVATVKDANGSTNHFAYDALNRLNKISYGDGQVVAYTFDPNGNRTKMTDPHGSTSYQYDSLNRLTAVTSPDGKTVKSQYNAVGSRQSLIYPDGKAVSYVYDQVNRLSQAQDWLGRTTSYSYDPAGNLLSLAYPNHAGMSFAYDAANRLTGVSNSFHTSGSDAVASHNFGIFQYLLDAVGNRLQVSNGRGKMLSYSYDKLYELTSVNTQPSGDNQDDEDDSELVASYTYDPVGNRLQKTTPDGTLNYVYDADDRLLAVGVATFTYDPNGNRTSLSKTPTSIPIVYHYDAANRLISVAGGFVSSSFSYDGDGNRIAQAVQGGTYNYLNDIAAALPVVLQESGPDGNISYAYGLGRISESSDIFDFFHQYDGLGSVVGLTNADGNLKQRYTYDAWGETLHIMGSREIGTKNKFQFTGEALDPATRLYYLRARYYDSTVGRFISRDVLPGFIAIPLSSNRYQYSLGNPIRYTDPSGLSAAETTNSAASLLAICGINCDKIGAAIFDAIRSATINIVKIFQQGANAQTSVSATDAGNTALQTGAAVVVNPDTVTAVVGTAKSQPNLIRDAAGLLSNHYSKTDLDLAYGVVCSNSYGAGICLRGQQFVESLIMKSAQQQGLLPSF
jgi:RHS repeat-associated protein